MKLTYYLQGCGREIEFGPRVMVIGPNGSGKTQIMSALAYMLLDRDPWRDLGPRDLAKLAPDGRMSCSLSVNGRVFFRGWAGGRHTFAIDGRDVSKTRFMEVVATLGIEPWMLRPSLLGMTGPRQQALIRRLFGGDSSRVLEYLSSRLPVGFEIDEVKRDSADELEAEISQELRRLDKDIRVRETVLEDVMEKLAAVPACHAGRSSEIEGRLRQTEDLLQTKRAELAVVENKIDEIRSQLPDEVSPTAIESEIDSVVGWIKWLEKKCGSFNGSLDEEIGRLKGERERLGDSSVLDEAARLREEYIQIDVDEAKRLAQDIEIKIAGLTSEKRQAETEHAATLEQLQEAEKERRDVIEKACEFETGGDVSCPLCGSSTPEVRAIVERWWDRATVLEKEIEELRGTIVKIEEKISWLGKQIEVEQENLGRQCTVINRAKEIEQFMSRHNLPIDSPVKEIAERVKKINQTLDTLNALREASARHDRLQRMLSLSTELLEHWEPRLSELQRQIRELEQTRSATEQDLEQIRQIARLRTDETVCRQELQQLLERRDRYALARAAVNQIRSEIARDCLDAFCTEVNKLLHPTPYRITGRIVPDTRAGSFDLSVKYQQGEIALEAAPGGVRALVALAIHAVLVCTAAPQLLLLCVDEDVRLDEKHDVMLQNVIDLASERFQYTIYTRIDPPAEERDGWIYINATERSEDREKN